MDRLTRQFWVTKEQVKANKYDLSASRYRQVDADAVYHEKPSVTLERLARLESVMLDEISELKKLVKMNTDWQLVKLGEIIEVVSQGTTPTKYGVAFLLRIHV